MKKLKLVLDNETRPIWETVLRAKREVDAWPRWLREYYQMETK